MKRKVRELKKELLGKELTLLELDNYMQKEIEGTNNSLFDDENQALEENGWAYQTNSNLENPEGVIICWEIIEDNENTFKKLVKVTNIEEI